VPAQVEKLLRRKSTDSIMARRPMTPSDVQAEYMRAIGWVMYLDLADNSPA
jgi:hypothetical protein